PINFTVVFSAPVIDFTAADVNLSGTAGASRLTLSGSGTTYNVAVTGMQRSGTVIATVPPDVATAANGTLNTASTSSDNTVSDNAPPPPPVTISGTVFQDINVNGVQDPGEPGMAGQTLFLDLDGSGALKDPDPTATTDANGNFQFSLATAGTY